MYTILVFIDEENEEIETSRLEGMSIKETLDVIEKTSEFMAGPDRLRYEKDNWIAVDFREKIVEVKLKDI